MNDPIEINTIVLNLSPFKYLKTVIVNTKKIILLVYGVNCI